MEYVYTHDIESNVWHLQLLLQPPKTSISIIQDYALSLCDKFGPIQSWLALSPNQTIYMWRPTNLLRRLRLPSKFQVNAWHFIGNCLLTVDENGGGWWVNQASWVSECSNKNFSTHITQSIHLYRLLGYVVSLTLNHCHRRSFIIEQGDYFIDFV